MNNRVSRRGFLATSGAIAAGGGLFSGMAGVLSSPAWADQADEDGYELWLRYRRVDDTHLLHTYRTAFTHVVTPDDPTGPERSAAQELTTGLSGLLGKVIRQHSRILRDGAVVIGTPSSSPLVAHHVDPNELAALGPEGYVLTTTRIAGRNVILVASSGPSGVLYGAFHLLRLVQTRRPVHPLRVVEKPANPLRMANHWDYRDRVVQWGYVGRSIFRWDDLPELDPRYTDYARALASIGINASVVNIINAEYEFLTTSMIQRLASLAGVLRAWGVRLFLSPNFFSPRALGGLPTADPLDPAVRAWWRDKVDEIYATIPDFGGFLVKADSEGQPGPLTYGRTHADGANVMAEALRPHGGIVIWRAFVGHEAGGDLLRAAYDIFTPLDGDFADNAIVQVKYGPLDFQIREPAHPLFGAMPQTNLMLELQITKEYTGSVRHLVYLPPLWKEIYDFDTHANGPGTTVADVVSGQASNSSVGGVAGVMNVGSVTNWTGHHLSAANTHGFGRLAWDPALDPAELAEEWTRMTFGHDRELISTLSRMLLSSREIYESYTAPGMCGMTGRNDPTPEWGIGVLPDATHIGFDRTVATGTGSVEVYPPPVVEQFGQRDTCPDELLLFFHRVPYSYRRPSGETVLQTIYDSYFTGVEEAKGLRAQWRSLRAFVDERRYREVLERLDDQVAHATLWRDRMVSHFFARTTVLDERRQWLQLDLPAGSVLTLPPSIMLIGGWPNALDVRVGNASPAPRTVSVGLDTPDGWEATTATLELAARDIQHATLIVTPPLDPADAPLRPTTDADGLVLGSNPTPVFVAPAGQRAVLALDAGPDNAAVPVLPGYRRLTPADQWDPARGYGWVGPAPLALDRGGALDPLRRDTIYDREPRTLRLAVPAGRWTALLLVGDREWAPIYPTYVRVDGELVAEGEEHLEGNDYSWLRFELDGGEAGREVDIELSTVENRWDLPQQAPTTGAWHLGALVLLDLEAPMPAIAVTGVSVPRPMFCGRANRVTATAVNTTDHAVTVRVTVEVPDGWSATTTERTIPPGGTEDVEVTVTPPAEPTLAVRLTVVVDAGEDTVGGARHDVECLAAPAGDTAALALDAGSATSPVVAGYTRLAPESAWDPARGFGWVSDPPQSRDRGEPLDALRRDFVNDVVERTLRLAVPAGSSRADVLIGDSVPSQPTFIHEGETLLAESPPLGFAEFTWLHFVLDGGENGREVDLRLSSTPGQHWHLGALVLTPA